MGEFVSNRRGRKKVRITDLYISVAIKVQYKLFDLLNVLKSGLYLLKSANSTKPKSFLEHELSKKD